MQEEINDEGWTTHETKKVKSKRAYNKPTEELTFEFRNPNASLIVDDNTFNAISDGVEDPFDESHKKKKTATKSETKTEKKKTKQQKERIPKKQRKKQQLEKQPITTTLQFEKPVQQEQSTKPRKKKKKEVVQITDIDKAAKQIEEGAVRKAIKRAIQTYSDDVLLQLKDFASFLESQFLCVDWKHSYEEDEPLNYLKEECQKPVRDWLSEIKADVLLEMIIFIINAIYNDKGIQNTKESLVGIKIFLQLIVRTRPEIFVDNISEIQKRFPVTEASLRNFVWILQQVVVVNKILGLKAWSAALYPVLISNAKESCKKQAISVLSSISEQMESPEENVKDPISREAFLWLLEAVHEQEEFSKFSEFFEDVVIPSTFKDTKVYLDYFPKLLHKLRDEKISDELKSEVLELLSTAITKNEKCIDLWEEMFHKYIRESTLLVKSLRSHDLSKLSQSRREKLNNTIQKLSVKVLEMQHGQSKKSKSVTMEELSNFYDNLEELRTSVKTKSFCGTIFRYFMYFVLLIAVLIGGLLYTGTYKQLPFDIPFLKPKPSPQ